MKLRYLLFSLILLNCAPPGNYYYHYDFDCATVNSEFRLNEKGVKYKFELAQQLFDAKFGPGEFCRLSNSVEYYIRNTCSWDHLAGYTNWDNRIQLEKRMEALNHELIHVYEGQHLKTGTTNHVGWNDKILRYDGSYFSNYDISWEFNNAISPYTEAHPEGFDLEELAAKTGRDGYECWAFQRTE